MADRYFVESPIAGTEALLIGSEAHHLAHVMRAKAGDEVTLFDGQGAEFLARVERLGRAEIELRVLERRAIDRESPVSLTLGVALPKGDRERWLVEKAVEIGVARLLPLACERGTHRESSWALDRLRRAVIEASKQCGRNRLMEIAPPEKLAEYLVMPVEGGRLLADPTARGSRTVFEDIAATWRAGSEIRLAIGPEGGFTPTELDLARSHGWRPLSLGRRILRVETAALALAAILLLRLEREPD